MGSATSILRPDMYATVKVGLCAMQERMDILRTILRGTTKEMELDYGKIAEVTDEFSGSDPKERCRAAMITPAREVMLRISRALAQVRQCGEVKVLANGGAASTCQIRPATSKDILSAR